MVTAEQLKNALPVSTSPVYIPVRDCSICGAEVAYVVFNGDLYFDGHCDCVRYRRPPELRPWQSAANHINNLPTKEERKAAAKKFGLEIST